MEKGVSYMKSSGGVLKKKDSSGCLIIKKRPRLILSDSESDDGVLGPRVVSGNVESGGEKKVKRDYGVGSSRDSVVDKAKQPRFDNIGGNSKGQYGVGSSRAKKSYLDNTISSSLRQESVLREKYGEGAGEPIRLQGKNGVLKVMVNKKTMNMGVGTSLYRKSYEQREVEDRKACRFDGIKIREERVPLRMEKGEVRLQNPLPTKSLKVREVEINDRKVSRVEDPVTKNATVRPLLYSNKKRPENPSRLDNSDVKLRKISSTKSTKAKFYDTDGSHEDSEDAKGSRSVDDFWEDLTKPSFSFDKNAPINPLWFGKSDQVSTENVKVVESGADKSHVDAEERNGSRSDNAVRKNVMIRPLSHSDAKLPEKWNPLRTEKSELKLRKSSSTKSSKAGDSQIDVHQEAECRKGSKSDDAVKRNLVIRPPLHPDTKCSEKQVPLVKREKNELKLRNPTKTTKAGDSEAKDCDKPLKLGMGTINTGGRISVKTIGNEGKLTPPTENDTPIKSKEGKMKRGNGTEKQLLREKIRSMLLNAGWKIDYRPRRNRDYQDAVYINRSGTAFWSIIKAYDALQKELGEADKSIKPSMDSSSFTPLPEETLNKLTRQTQKKIEREMKKRKREEGGSKSEDEPTVKGSAYQHNKKLCSSDKRMFKQDRVEKPSTGTSSHMIPGRKSGKFGRCTLLVRNSDKEVNSEADIFVPYTGKRTVLSWLVDSGVVRMGEKVQYLNRRKNRVMLEGWITRDGIHCRCCSKILTMTKFEIHAGSKQRLPYLNIYLESETSLMQCQLDAWNKQEEFIQRGFHAVDVHGDDPNDDTCGLCADGGDLICCDGCPSTFHQSCLDIPMLPPGDWHCPNCRCKYCGIGGDCITEATSGTVSTLLMCSLCEKKYHEACSQDMDGTPTDSSDATTFCGQKCRELSVQLQKLLGVKHELESGYSWSLICRMDPFDDTLPLGLAQKVECNSKLAVALSVMDECFLPIVDRRSGINLLHSVVHNCRSNLSRLNYSGFYTVILERGDEIVSAASIRIHGSQLAEMPFIGTRHIHRRRGMCRRLFSAIESLLCSLKVEKMIIPAVVEHMHTWTQVFKFSPLEESDKEELRSMNILVFPGIDMLQKPLVEQEIPEGTIIANSDAKSIEVKEIISTNSQSVKKLAEPNTDFKGPSPSCKSSVILETGNPVFVPPVKVKIRSSADGDVRKVSGKASSTGPLIDSLGGSFVKNVKEEADENSNLVTASTSNGDFCEARGKDSCIRPVIDSLGESFARNKKEEADENPNLITASSSNGIEKMSSMQLELDLNHNSDADMDAQLTSGPECKSEFKIAPVENSIQSVVVGDMDETREVHVPISEPVLDSLGSISANNSSEETTDNQKSTCVSASQGTDEVTLSFNGGLHEQDLLKVDTQVFVASKVLPGEVEISIQSVVAGEVDASVSHVAIVVDSAGETSVPDITRQSMDI